MPLSTLYTGGEFKITYKNIASGLNFKYNIGDVIGELVIVKRA